ncbi:MAG TPA: coenzyme F420-0:L-glutamate ligase [Ardenticatenaceae bacterium]|nr:coenzyme F420-0:L-glutamate ligase [Ardenticatenaceae bacterium]
MQAILTALPDFPLVKPGDDIAALILERLAATSIALQDDDILVIAHKIISKAEGRLIELADVTPSAEAERLAAVVGKDPRFLELVLRESVEVLRTRPGLIVTEQRLGWVVANAAIDRSNIFSGEDQEQVALLPLDPDASAARLRARLLEVTGARVAVIVNDTHGRPFRVGVIGVAIGVAGIAPVSDLRGEPDLFGYVMQTTESAAADEIASAASMLQGQTGQGRPVVHIRGVPFRRDEHATSRALVRPKELDMFR